MIIRKTIHNSLKSKYGYEIVEQHYDYEKNEIEKENIIPSSHRRKMVPSIPVSIMF